MAKLEPKETQTHSKHIEFKLQVAICKYLEMQYPESMFVSDAISNIALTEGQKVRNKQIQKRDFSCPDLMIFKVTDKYCGLFLELKATSPYTKEGVLKKQVKTVKDPKTNIVVDTYDHLKEQDRALRRLRNEGYKAEFCWSIEMAIRIIDDYHKNK